jgi:cardiolipin synthase
MITGQRRRRRQAPASLERIIADQIFFRVAGAPLIAGNDVRLLRDAQENYPAWMEAIRSAERHIHFECYLIHEDPVGREMAELLIARAQAGVRVRLIYDWLGSWPKTSRRFWEKLRRGGVEVRCFNPPQFASPFAWLSRNHRKMLAVDTRTAFVTGLCVGQLWLGGHGLQPWRDTGVMVRGPAVADIEEAFAQSWAATGPGLPEEETPDREALAPEGDMLVQVVATTPWTAGVFRLDQLIAARAQHYLWLTDAYFVSTTLYVQALRAAAGDGVDVRLLVPGSSDIPVLGSLSRAMYRPLLEAGVRVFEWNGSMLHAKTAVADGRWARVGSTNLNLASWIGNWELDLAVTDETFAAAMEQMYLEDLARSTEIVLTESKRIRAAEKSARAGRGTQRARRAAVGTLGVSRTIGAAITNGRVLDAAEARVTAAGGVILLGLAAVTLVWPAFIAIPLGLLGIWVGLALLARAYRLLAEKRGRTGTDRGKK